MKEAVSIGNLPLGPVPLVVGVISSERALAQAAVSRPRPYDVAEIRVDLVGVDSERWLDHARDLADGGTPVIVTVRHKQEGGHWYLDETERVAVYQTALPFVSALDAEIHSEIFPKLARAARAAGKPMIGSFHDFTRTPSSVELDAVVREGLREKAHVVKLATFINEAGDVARLAELLKKFPDQHLCLLGMGPLGSNTRVTLAQAGSCITYGFVDESTAPGQLSAVKLRERLMEEHVGYREFARTRT